MIRNIVYDFVVPCFIFELYTILYDWLMMSFCLQNLKKMYEIDYVSKMKIDSKNFLRLTCLSQHHIGL